MSETGLQRVEAVEPASVDRGASRMFRRAFWGAIIVMAVLSLTVVGLAVLRQSTGNLPAVVEEIVEPSYDVPDDVVGRAVKTAAESARKKQDARIDGLLAEIFAPAYAAIPKYSDFHYSVLGEYTELGAAAMGKMSGRLSNTLFAGLEERVSTVAADLDSGFQVDFSAALDDEIARHLDEADVRGKLSESSTVLLSDVKSRMALTAPLAGAAAIGTAVPLKSVAAVVAKKLAAKTAAKAASKTAAKSTGALGSAGTAAAVCSPGGPVASAACGVGAALVAWLAVDAVVVNLDEYFNRDEFEAELERLVDEQRTRLRIAISNALTVRADQTADFTFRSASAMQK